MKVNEVITVSSDGGFAIPKSLQEALGVKPGDQFKVKMVGEQIVLQPILEGSPLDVLHGMFAGEDLLTDLENAHRQEVENDKKVRS